MNYEFYNVLQGIQETHDAFCYRVDLQSRIKSLIEKSISWQTLWFIRNRFNIHHALEFNNVIAVINIII